MSIKKNGGIFGRNPTYYNVEVENDLRVGGDLIINGETVTGLDFEGSWDASTNTPDVTASPTVGQFWIVSVAGSTDLSGITTWDVGDWALYDGSAWQRVEGGGNGTFTKVNVDNLQLDGNTISSTDTDGDVILAPNGTGQVEITGTQPARMYGAGGSGLIKGDDLFTISSSGKLASSLKSTGAAIIVLGSESAGGGAQAGTNIQFWTNENGYTNTVVGLRAVINRRGGFVTTPIADGTTVFNEDGVDANFRVESSTDPSAFFIDGGTSDVTIGSGNLIIGTSGKGIDFSATAGTGTSELLNDYEEGTWSPTYDDTGGTGSYTQDVSRGLYTKVGNKVTVHFEVRTDAVSGTTGDVIITGLPFTPSGTDYNETGVGAVAALTIQGFTTQAPTACVAQVSGNIALVYDNGGVTANLPAANLGTGTNSNRLRGTVTYLIA